MPETDEAPGCSWAVYVELLVAAHGGWSAVVDMLMHRARGSVELPNDPQTIERGLRRLSTRGNAPGGKYGRWLLRFFGIPEPLAVTARWMGQYHSRFTDLPVSLCESQLRTWDRPPICESSVAAWIHLGLAAVAMRRRAFVDAAARLARGKAHHDPEHASDVRMPLSPKARSMPDTASFWLRGLERQRRTLGRVGLFPGLLARATPLAAVAGREAELEATLLDARLASERADGQSVERALDRAEQLAATLELADERACYRARIADQRAYQLLHARDGSARIAEARARYAAIDGDVLVPFVLFRRAHGLGYCEWKLGNREHAMARARAAAEHAADAGLVRFRVMAFTSMTSSRRRVGLGPCSASPARAPTPSLRSGSRSDSLAAITGGEEALALRQRAARMGAMLEHEPQV